MFKSEQYWKIWTETDCYHNPVLRINMIKEYYIQQHIIVRFWFKVIEGSYMCKKQVVLNICVDFNTYNKNIYNIKLVGIQMK